MLNFLNFDVSLKILDCWFHVLATCITALFESPLDGAERSITSRRMLNFFFYFYLVWHFLGLRSKEIYFF